MNKKNKNKNKQNKPPNPVPPQTEENVEKSKIIEKSEERVPEIITVAPPAEVKNEAEFEMPRKPKRNRGKKIAQDKDDEKQEEVKEETLPLKEEPIVEVLPAEVAPLKDETGELTVPSSRKKNKNKKNPEKVVVEAVDINKPDIKPTDIFKEETACEFIGDIAVTDKNIRIGDVAEQDNSQGKKKNKTKKNKKGKIEPENIDTRTDIISETKIDVTDITLEAASTPLPIKPMASESSKEKDNKYKKQPELDFKLQDDKFKVESDTIQVSEQDQKQAETVSTTIKEETKNETSKNKKKNKKKRTDSEHSEGACETKSKQEYPTDTSLPPKQKVKEPNTLTIMGDSPKIPELPASQEAPTKSNDNKQKNEKKHIKTDLTENVDNTLMLESVADLTERMVDVLDVEPKLPEESLSKVIDIKESPKETPSCPTRKDKGKGKPKSTQQTKSEVIEEQKEIVVKKFDIIPDQTSQKLLQAVEPNIGLKDLVQNVGLIKQDVLLDKIIESIKLPMKSTDTIIKDQETKKLKKTDVDKSDIIQDPAIETIKEDSLKSKKKNKKDKKHPHVSESILPITEESEKFDVTMEPQEIITVQEISHKNEKIKFDLPPLELKLPSALELQSLKIEDSDVSDLTPDSIEHPRSASQQSFTDPNNNMVIEEIGTETKNLNVPIVLPDTPFIKGDFPDAGIAIKITDTVSINKAPEFMLKKKEMPTTDTKASGAESINYLPALDKPSMDKPPSFTSCLLPEKSEINLYKNTPIATGVSQKTDLKSKVMEVNQDMEELRLSIEKSLAELTTLEKCEEMPELVSIPLCEPLIKQPIAAALLPVTKTELPKIDEIELKPTIDVAVSLKTLLGLGKPESKTQTSDHSKISFSISHAEQPFAPTSLDANKINTVKQSICPAKIDKGKEKIGPTEQAKPEANLMPQFIPDLSQVIELSEIKTSMQSDEIVDTDAPSCPTRKDKGKGKSKKKYKNDDQKPTATSSASTVQTVTITTDVVSTTDTVNKSEQKQESTEESQDQQKKNNEKQTDEVGENKQDGQKCDDQNKEFDPIEKFEDAMTSSADDVNKTFELIVGGVTSKQPDTPQDDDDKKIDEKHENPLVSQPKNLLGHPDIPVPSNKMDYKKEKNRTPNTKQAKVRIKDSFEVDSESLKQSKESQTDLPRVVITKPKKDFCENDDYIYKYSFRKVYLPHGCHVCKKELRDVRVACNYCSMLFYCSQKHKDEDWTHHQALCFAICTIAHLKGQKHIYADAKDVTGLNYRLLRMQMIISCEKVLKRRLVPWEQEALLYPRICAEPSCREWRQASLKDCEGCKQISYCKDDTNHYPKSHNRWCKSYSLYQKLVLYQQTKGRLEPRMPTKVLTNMDYEIPEKINKLLATMYEEKIDMDDLQYATLTQLATAPLTAAFCYQTYVNKLNGACANGIHKKPTFTLHVVGAELQFEADALNKWEVFFLHLRPDIKVLNVVLVGPELNPSNLPLELLAKIRLCEDCRQKNRKVIFNFHDKLYYHEFAKSDDFSTPDMVCAFNPSLNRSVGINGKDFWPTTVNSILKQRTPLCITSYTPAELPKDLDRIRQCAAMDVKIVTEPCNNPYSSIRPDRNFISDDEMPLLFKNHSYMIVCGQF